jgi:hypothetical protein
MMNFILRTSLLLSAIICSKVTLAEQNDGVQHEALTVSPKQCTTLKQGETCYLDLEVVWRTSTEKSTCLFANANKLQCWHNKKQGELKKQITMRNDLVLTLQTVNKQVLHTQTIRYAWVHKKNNSKAMRWRMF